MSKSNLPFVERNYDRRSRLPIVDIPPQLTDANGFRDVPANFPTFGPAHKADHASQHASAPASPVPRSATPEAGAVSGSAAAVAAPPLVDKPLSSAWNTALAATGAVATMTAAAQAAKRRTAARKNNNANTNPRPMRAVFCLGLQNPVRKLCIKVVEWKYPFFESFFSLTT